jgi:hypothetical protein
MANHPYNIGDEVLVRGRITAVETLGNAAGWLEVAPLSGPQDHEYLIAVHSESITQCTPKEPNTEKSVVLDRYGFTWQRIGGLWQRGTVAREWVYLLEHAGPVKVIYRGEP